jgi:hypothetical protein
MSLRRVSLCCTLRTTIVALLFLGLNALRAATTVTFTTTDNASFGTATLSDGSFSSNDVAGIVINFFTANSSGTANGTTLTYDATDPSNKGVIGDFNNGDPMFVIKRASGTSSFWLTGFLAVDPYGVSNQIKVQGFLGGTSTGSAVTVTIGGTFVKTLTTSDLPPAQFQNVDEVRITATSGSLFNDFNQFAFDNPVVPPAVSSVSPTSGPTAGGTSITITGTTFTGATAVKFGSTNASSYTVNSATQITATSPAGSAGTVDITVTGAGGTSSTSSSDHFTYVAAPTVTAVSPTSGPAAGATSVTITGTNFTGATAVKFGATNASSFTVNSATQITATSPAHSAGTIDITVTTVGGTSATSASDQFTYVAAPTVTSVSPTAGPTAGGTSVTITGTNLTGATAVKFGATNASSFTVNSATQITATSPSGSAGTVDITVTTTGGTSATSASDQFTYVAAPTITSVSPTAGPTGGGTSVTVTGTNLTGATAVKFGASNASSFTVNSATQITATSPSGSAGTVDITATTVGGTSATSSNDQFTYVAAPVINSSLTASGTYGSAISTYTITATNTPTSYNATGLPPGLSVNTGNGQITGTPTATAGSPYSVTISATNAGGTGNATLVFTINKATLTISGVTASNKTYDGTTTATLNTGSAVLNGAVNSDSLSLDSSGATGSFSDRNANTGKTVTTSGFVATGTNVSNYTLTQPTTTADISAKALTVTGVSATGTQVYNGATSASLAGTAAFLTAETTGSGTTIDGKPYTVDSISIGGTATGTFANRNVGTAKAITVTGITVTGTDASNYTVTQPTGLTGDVTAKALTVTGVTATGTQVYNGTTTTSITGTAAFQTAETAGSGATSDGKPYTVDTISIGGAAAGTFASRNVGTAKAITVTGITVTNTDAANYTVTQPTGLTGDITAKALTVSGVTAVATRTYDGTTTAGLSGTAAFQTAESAGSGATSDGRPYTVDTISIGGSAAGAFANRNVGTAKAITVTGITVGSTDAANYTVTQPIGLTEDVTTKPLTITGLSATGTQVYNGTTTASLTGTAGFQTAETAGSGATNDGKPYTVDSISVGGTTTGTFADRNVGTAKAITVTGITVGGTDAANYSVTQPTGFTGDVTAKPLTVTGVTATGTQIYNGTTTASIGGTAAFQSAETAGSGTTSDGKPYTVDTIAIGGSAAGTFANRNVGTAKAITVTGITVGNTDAANYTVTQPTGLTGDVTAKTLTISGVTAVASRTYDGTTTAGLGGTAAFQSAETAGSGTTGDGKPYTVDSISVGGTAIGAFADRNVATAKTITVTGITAGGTDGGNYSVTQPTGLTADITTKALTVSGLSASNKIYDATTTATLTGTAALQSTEAAGAGTTSDGKPYTGDTVSLSGAASGTFTSKDVATGIGVTVTGITLTGGQATNYSVTQPTGLSANITTKALTASGLTASNKTYDATTNATLSGAAVLQGAEAAGAGATSDGKPYTGDTVSLTGTATGTFGTAAVGTTKTVTIAGLSLTGGQAGNYSLTAPTTTADIATKALTVSGLSASNKIYDATTPATLTGTAALQSAETAGSGTTSDGKPYTGDTVSLSGTASGAFASKDVNTGIAVTVTGITLTGAQATNYSVTQPTGITANITVKSLTVSGLTASNKTYDATTNVSLSGTAVLPSAEAPGAGTTSDGKPYTGDTVSLSGTASGAFADTNVGTAKTVVLSGLSLGGGQASNYALSSASVTANISAKALTISGVTASNKVYDATTTAPLGGTSALGSTEAPGAGSTSDGLPYTGDTVSTSGTAAGTFADRHVATGKAVTVTGITLSGAQAGNYTPTQPTGLTANITTKALTVSGLSASNKVYDATTAASLTGTAALLSTEAAGTGSTSDGAPYTGDTISLSGTASGAFGSKDVATGITVTVSGITLSGAQATDYSATQPTGLTANITTKSLTISGLAASGKTYDATTIAGLSGTAVLQSAEAAGAGTTSDGKPYTGDTVSVTGTASGTFADKNIGVGKAVTVTGLSLTGAQAGNYASVQPTGLTANITTKALTVSGLTASNKLYDATTTATLTGTASLQASEAAGTGTNSDGKPFTGDVVSLSGTATGTYASKDVATGIAVTVTGLTLSGGQSTNYTVTQPTGLTADITVKSLTISGLTASNKTYDATTSVSLSGSAALQTAEAAGVGTTSDGKPYTGDTVSLSGTASGAFADANAGTSKTVTISGVSLSGAQASNYALSTTSVTANITAKALTLSGVTASNKVYDGTTTAPLSGTATLGSAEAPGSGSTSDGLPYTGDTVSLNGTASGAFVDRHVATGKAITVTGLTLAGGQAGNYTPTPPTGLTANITTKSLTATGLGASNKIYDAATVATLTGTAALLATEAPGAGSTSDGAPYTGDTVSLSGTANGTFASKNVATGVAVTVSGLTLSGVDATDYSLTPPAGLNANITTKTLSVSGFTASDKVYDGTTAAVLSGSATLLSAEAPGAGTTNDGKPYTGDTMNTTGVASGAFADRNVGTGKTVTVTGVLLTGAQAGNYAVQQPGGLTANITAKALTVAGLTAGNKVYDGTTAATFTGTATLQPAETAGTGASSDGKPYSLDTVTIGGTAAGTFAAKTVANGIAVTVTGLTLSGAQGSNYTVTQPTGLTANIAAKALTVTGLTASNKTYDGSTTASITGTAALQTAEATGTGASSDGKPYTGDTVSVAGTPTGAFSDANAGNSKPVAISGLSLSGADVVNYSLTAPATTANITTASVAINLSNLNQTYDGTPKSVSATATPSTSVTVTYNGSASAPINAGSYSVAASVGGNYSGSASGTLVIAKASQTISFPSALAAATIALNATASSGLPVTYSVLSGTGSIAGSTLTVTGSGSVAVRATQAGNDNYLVATADQTFNGLSLPTQTITFAAIGDKVLGSPPIRLNANASSGLPVSFTVVSGHAILILGDKLTLTGVGSVTVRASQPGNASIAPAPDVTQTFQVSLPRIFFGDCNNSGNNQKIGDVAGYLPPTGSDGTLLIVIPGLNINSVVNFHLLSDGTFSSTITLSEPIFAPASDGPRIAATGNSFTVHGALVGNVLSGTIDGLNLPFSANLVPSDGATATMAGLYQSSDVNTSTGTTASIVGTQGQVLVVASTASITAGGVGTVNSSGSFSIAGTGATISGAIDAPSTSITGAIRVSGGPSVPFSGLNTTTPRTDRLINLSSRARVGTGDRVLITGFVIGGTDPKQILVRGVGPGLTNFGIQGVLANPRIQLYNNATGQVVAQNDDWGSAATASALASTMTRVGAFALSDNSADSAILATLQPGSYSVQVFDGGNTGVAIAEVYDASGNPQAEYQRLVNISTRGMVDDGENVLIGGFVVSGNSPKKMLIRGVGPSLAQFNVSGVITDPKLTVFSSTNAVVAQNDNWQAPTPVDANQTAATGTDISAAAQATGAFGLLSGSKDAAVLITLAPGTYTAQVSGVNGATGVGLVEIYEVPSTP